MIVPMKKVSLVILDKEKKEALKRLQKEAKITVDGVYGNNTASALQKRL